MSAYLNALLEEGSKERLREEVVRLYNENEALRKSVPSEIEPKKEIAWFLETFIKAIHFHDGHGTPSFGRAEAELMYPAAKELLKRLLAAPSATPRKSDQRVAGLGESQNADEPLHGRKTPAKGEAVPAPTNHDAPSDKWGETIRDVIEKLRYAMTQMPRQSFRIDVDDAKFRLEELLKTDRSAIGAPAGWKLVPIEPTSDMIDVGGATPKMKIIDGYCSTAQLRGGFTEDRIAGPKSDCAIAQVYKAMLAAAPSYVGEKS